VSELLGPEQRIDEVEHEPRGHEAGERIIEDHGTCPLQVIAGDGVAHRQGEEDEAETQHDDVQHLHAPSGAEWRRYYLVRAAPHLICIDRAKDSALFRQDMNCHLRDIFSRGEGRRLYRNLV
jgi:hypothetical protein